MAWILYVCPFSYAIFDFGWQANDTTTAQLSLLIAPDKDLSNNITTLSASSFDPRNQYSGVFKAVRAAASGKDEDVEVKVYRVEVGPSRVEYFVLGLDTEQGRVVGFRAKAVET